MYSLTQISQVTVKVSAFIAILEGEWVYKMESSNEKGAEKQFPHLSVPNRKF